MNRISHVFVALIISVLTWQLSLGVKMKRPQNFFGSIMGNGNDGKFTNIKTDIVNHSGLIGLQNANLDLAHVFPWAAIDACVDLYWVKSKQSKLNNLVKVIFQQDTEAVVTETFVDNPNVLNEFLPDSTSIIKHAAYLRSALKKENTALKTKAQAICKPTPNLSTTSLKNQRECKELLHNAPANLRFGAGVANRHIISDRLDFMGKSKSVTNNGKIRGIKTTKEDKLLQLYEECYADVSLWCNRKTRKYCESGHNGFGLRSSSSPYKIIY